MVLDRHSMHVDRVKVSAREVVEAGEEYAPNALLEVEGGVVAVELRHVPKPVFALFFTDLLQKTCARSYILAVEAWAVASMLPTQEGSGVRVIPADDKYASLIVIEVQRGGVAIVAHQAVIDETPVGKRLRPWTTEIVLAAGQMAVLDW